ncbi:MAG: hypothetical protein R6V10_16765 [bacterium]
MARDDAIGSERPGWQRHGVVVFLYFVLALIMTWPVMATPGLYIISEYMDTSTAFYNLWWFHQAVCELHTWPWTNTLINYPYDFSMAMFPMWVPYDALVLPVIEAKGAHGLPLALNIIIIISFTARGYVTFVFVRYLVQKSPPAFLAGVVLAFSPYVFWNITRVHASCLELVVLLVYFFLRTLRERDWKPAAGLSASACLLLYTSPSYTADMVLFLPLLGIYTAMREREAVLTRSTLVRLAAAAAVTLAVCSPFLYHVLSEMIKNPVPIAQPHDLRVQYSANLMGFVSPGWNLKAYSWLTQYAPYSDPELTRSHGIGGHEIFMGYVFIAAALAGAVRYFRRCFIYIVLCLLFMALSLGPSLHAGASTYAAAMPYDFFHAIFPWLRFERTPVRHLGPALVALSVPAGFGMAWLGGLLSKRRAYVFYCALFAAVLLEYNHAPLKLDRFPVPGFVEEIKSDSAPGAVLNLPHIPDIKRLAGYYHMHHEKPLIFRLVSRGMDPEVQQSAIFRYLTHPRVWLRLSGDEREKALAELKRELDTRDVRYLAAYPRFMTEKDDQGLRNLVADLQPAEVIEDNETYFVCRFERWSGTKKE